MIDEFNALLSNDTWELVPPTNAHNLVASKWIFQIKYKFDETQECYEVGLVDAGNHQQVGNDFHDTFASVIRHATIRLVLSIAITKH